MKNPTPLTRSALGLALAALAFSAADSNAGVSGVSLDNGNGTYTYAYTVDNLGGLFDIVGFALDFGFPEALIDWNQLDTFGGGDVTVADPGWIAQAGIPVLGLSAQDFLSLDPNSDVLIGSSLSGFSFTSALPPGDITYFTFGAAGDSATGRTIGPVPIPESGTWIASGMLALGCGAILRRRGMPSRAV